jgi:hypothetical protein
VKLDCCMFSIDDLYVINKDVDDTPIFVSITHLLEHIGTWIICGLLTVAEKYNELTDSYIVRSTNDFIVVSPSELRSYGSIARVQLMGEQHVVLSHRIVS